MAYSENFKLKIQQYFQNKYSNILEGLEGNFQIISSETDDQHLVLCIQIDEKRFPSEDDDPDDDYAGIGDLQFDQAQWVLELIQEHFKSAWLMDGFIKDLTFQDSLAVQVAIDYKDNPFKRIRIIEELIDNDPPGI